ncbi:zinc finger protein 723 isoform X3 [Plutella xylostella]|uniref:zinc finger protein 723 isoform X2 n=1 Tax=Plutella xylostella TaxID=51655 RepID=UPI0020327387|nr:zinc finger protein 723 isoform X2 [Plutella xylostella]XP_048480027.1 zinc finger protein 723 isoform X3 [Plutella xylostella]
MEQDVESGLEGTLTSYRHICSICLSTDRNLVVINGDNQLQEVFRLLMYDFAGDRFSDPLVEFSQLACWECAAALRRAARLKRQLHAAQQQLQLLALGHETLDHTYITQSLSPLQAVIKTDYDGIYFDYSDVPERWGVVEVPGVGGGGSQAGGVKDEQFDVAQVVRNNIDLDMDMDGAQILEVGELDGVDSSVDASLSMAHIVLRAPSLPTQLPLLTVSPLDHVKMETVITTQDEGSDLKCGYVTEQMTEDEMRACRETMKEKVQYVSAAYKCELCIIGFYSQQQVEAHFVQAHRAKPDLVPCKICYVYVEQKKLESHTQSHYTRYTCKLCGHVEYSIRLQTQHVRAHVSKDKPDRGALNVPETPRRKKKSRKIDPPPPKPGDLRKLLSKTTIEGYKCLECDMFFKSSRSRKNHVDRFHREGLQCDHCKKRFVNKTTLATHLKLHEGPLPREECPVCHKMVRSIQIKYHIQRHQNSTTYTCHDCNKIFSHLATYQAHLKYSRAHASEEIFKFPCPMCNKGYPSKEQMQDHFNYQHLGKTAHKCPVCDKPIASRANVEKHMMRVHGEKKQRPRTHVCQHCGKGFTDKKALTQHAVIHSGERPLSCDICQQSFKQKASLYTHRKRVHKVIPEKKVVEFMDKK